MSDLIFIAIATTVTNCNHRGSRLLRYYLLSLQLPNCQLTYGLA